MKFMNVYDIEESVRRWRGHPVLGPASRTLNNLMVAVDRNSDGWAYWPKPVRAAEKLMDLIEGDRSWEARHGNRPDATVEQLKAAYRPLKAFRTRHGIDFPIEEAV